MHCLCTALTAKGSHLHSWTGDESDMNKMKLVVFARVGWMRWYRGPQPDDEKPIGGGGYTKTSLGHEAFNFLPLSGRMFGYFQPVSQQRKLRRKHSSIVALERIQADFRGDVLENVEVVFVATHPRLGSQRIVGWFHNATVYRHKQPSSAKERQRFSYFLETSADTATLVPEKRREFIIPGGAGAFGQANVCYVLDKNGKPKKAGWIGDALKYVDSYALENAAADPESDTDAEISHILGSTIERAAGFQSNPRIKKAIEDYAMAWAERRLSELRYEPTDTHKTKPYDFLCKRAGGDLYVEVKGTQEAGQSVSLSPREVEHAEGHKNSMLFIVHSVGVKGKRNPVVSGGKERIIDPWDISKGVLKPHSFVFTLS